MISAGNGDPVSAGAYGQREEMESHDGTSLTDGATVAIVIVDISPELSEKQEAAVCISGNEDLWSQNILL